MYTEYFGFREKPFNATPDPRFFYSNPVYEEAYASLVYGIQARKGFVVLTGEVGTGKTTLLRRLMNNLDATIRFVFFYNTTLSFEELLSFTCTELGISGEQAGRLQQIQALNDFLIAQLQQRGTAVLLIDEAQDLSEDVLENLRLLSNLETGSEKLLQIVLVGQPELDAKLNQPQLRQLKQRVTIQCRLDRLKDHEVGLFIDYRLQAVGYKRRHLFTTDAVREVAFSSKGIPRLINVLCDNALLIAYAASQKRVSGEIMREAASDLRLVGKVADPASVGAEGEPESRSSQAMWRDADPFVRARWGARRQSRPMQPWVWRFGVLMLCGLLTAWVYAWYADSPLQPFMKGDLQSFQHTLNSWSTAIRSKAADVVKSRGEPSETSSPASDGKATADTPTAKPDNPRALAVFGHRNQPSDASTDAHDNMAARWKGKPEEHTTVIRRGGTVAEIANTVYGSNKLLGLDLIKEFNPQIENLNRVSAGESLWLPPLSEETLVRKQADGSYRVIVGALSRTAEAEQFAQQIRQKRFEVTVTPRKISESMWIYRVEIVQLKDHEAAKRVWNTARANQWVPMAANTRPGGQSQQSLRAQPSKPLAAAVPIFQPRPTPGRLDSTRPASGAPNWASLPGTDRR